MPLAITGCILIMLLWVHRENPKSSNIYFCSWTIIYLYEDGWVMNKIFQSHSLAVFHVALAARTSLIVSSAGW